MFKKISLLILIFTSLSANIIQIKPQPNLSQLLSQQLEQRASNDLNNFDQTQQYAESFTPVSPTLSPSLATASSPLTEMPATPEWIRHN